MAAVFQTSQATEFKSRLRERAAQLRAEIRAALDKSKVETHVRIAERARDIEDDSFSNLMVDLNYADIDRDADELRRIDRALARLSDGTYGTCIECAQDIPLARLEAEPTADRCIRCQEIYEKTHATPSTPQL
jgi:RNA polymerase-binding protein DksA